jgi:hypothetical protein
VQFSWGVKSQETALELRYAKNGILGLKFFFNFETCNSTHNVPMLPTLPVRAFGACTINKT